MAYRASAEAARSVVVNSETDGSLGGPVKVATGCIAVQADNRAFACQAQCVSLFERVLNTLSTLTLLATWFGCCASCRLPTSWPA